MARPPSEHYFPGLSKLYASWGELAYLLVRVAAGAILIPHGMQKLFGSFGGPGMTNFTAALVKVGYLPSVAPLLAWLIALVEFAGGILLVIGLFTRPVAFAVLIFMLEAARHHMGVGGFFWTRLGNEYPLFFAAAALLILFRGGGPYSVDAKLGKEF